MLRTITLSLLMLISVVAMLPFANSTAHGIRQSVSSGQRRHYRRHSRAWWRRYRARLRRKREAALAAHRNGLLGPALPPVSGLTDPLLVQLPPALATAANASSADMKLPSQKAALPGQVSFSVVALSRPTPAYLTEREQSRMLAGIDVAEFRRIVIDKMITSGGWVTNDYVRDLSGQRVFVVMARTPPDGRLPEKTWSFYFTEVNGRIYNLTTSSAVEFSNRMEAEAELFIDSLRKRGALPAVKQ